VNDATQLLPGLASEEEATSRFEEAINQAQLKSLRLVSISILVMLLLYYGRNIVRFGFEYPTWHLMSSFVLVSIALVLTFAISLKLITACYCQEAGAALCLTYGFAILTSIVAGLTMGVYSSTLTILAASLCVLNLRHFTFVCSVFLLAWATAASNAQETTQWFPTLILLLIAAVIAYNILKYRRDVVAEHLKLNDKIDELESFISLCANCKKAKGSDGNWLALEELLMKEDHKQFSHGICRECQELLYADYVHRSSDGITE